MAIIGSETPRLLQPGKHRTGKECAVAGLIRAGEAERQWRG